jgi:hypothetical protein
MQMDHFYSIDGLTQGDHVPNQMASVTIFLDASFNSPDWPMLNKIICQWRRQEDLTREQCGLPSIYDTYTGCRVNTRGHRRTLRTQDEASNATSAAELIKSISVHDIMMVNYKNDQLFENGTAEPMKVYMDTETPEIDWDEFVRDVYEKEAEALDDTRHLSTLDVDYASVGPWNNYFGLLKVKTEYYFRYSG